MKVIGKFVGTLLGLFGIMLILSGTVSMFASTSGPRSGGPLTGAVFALIGLVFVLLGLKAAGRLRRSKQDAGGIDELARSAQSWMRLLDTARQFPPVDIGGMMLSQGETALLSESSTLIEQTTRTSRVSAGTRVMIGHQPFYFGRSEPLSKQVLREASQGRLTLTDESLLFSGNVRTLTIDLSKLMSIEPYSKDAVIVATRGKTKPSIFSVNNPLLWTLTVRMATQVPMKGGAIPPDARFDYGQESQVAVTS